MALGLGGSSKWNGNPLTGGGITGVRRFNSKSQEARVLLAEILTKHNIPIPITLPDISTKDKAQQYINLPMDDLRIEKKKFSKKWCLNG